MPDFIKSRYFLQYAAKKLRGRSFFGTFGRIAKYFHRFLLIGRMIKYIGIAVTVIETSALLIVIAAAAVVLVPLAVTVLAVFALIDRIIGSQILKNPYFKEYLERDRIFIITDAGKFGRGLAAELASSGHAVLILTYDLRYRFVSARRYGEFYFVRHSFFFRLKRTQLDFLEDRLIYLM